MRPPEDSFYRLDYDAETGKLHWNSGRNKDKVAGSKKSSGYIYLSYCGKHYLAHRVAWYKIYGRWPIHYIDHINGKKYDNRLKNLREVSLQENCMNMPMTSRNKSGSLGVFYREDRGVWIAQVRYKGRIVHTSQHKTKEIAEIRANIYRVKLGFHTNHGRQRES